MKVKRGFGASIIYICRAGRIRVAFRVKMVYRESADHESQRRNELPLRKRDRAIAMNPLFEIAKPMPAR